MVPYKRMDLIVEAFSQRPDLRLVVIGEGPEYKAIKSLAKSNIEFIGRQSLPKLVEYMQKARAFVFAAQEDFGIVPVEAQACGTPVISLGSAGTAETVLDIEHSDLPTGVWFKEQTIDSLLGAIDRFEGQRDKLEPLNCRKNAERFSPEIFKQRLANSIQNAVCG